MEGVGARIVYSDLDGTMVGWHGSFWHAADRSLVAEPADALLELHRAGVPLVLVSGRTLPQVVEAARVFGADGAIADLGALVSWHSGRRTQLLPGDMPAEHAGRTPISVMEELGVVERLIERHAGFLEWHAPWHADHTADALLRGRVDVAEVEAELAEMGAGWLTLNDNGALPSTARMTLAQEARPPRVYHLMPRGISKGAAVSWDLRRRGIDPADAVAIGDSVSDLEMAPHVGRLFVPANGAEVEGMAGLLGGVPNATVTRSAMGRGWAEAVRAVL
jgi:HAD superfamily hydrolase (TIGR01484 family)